MLRLLWFISFLVTLPLSVLSADQAEEIRLGVVIPLSGDYASYGRLIQHGVELATEDLNKEGRSVRVFYEDVPTPGRHAVTAIRKMITVHEVDGIAGNFWNPAIPAMAPMIERAALPTFHTAAADDLILAAGDYVFSTNSKIRDEARQLAHYARKQLGAQTACVLYIGTTFGENYSEHFIKEFERLGGQILYNEITALGQRDLRPVLTKVKAKAPDVFFAAYFGTNLGIVLKQARELKLAMPILSDYEAEDPTVIETAQEHANDIRFYVAEPDVENEEQAKVSARFLKRFGYAPRILGRNAYDATQLLVRALIACKKDRACAKDKLYAIKDYPGLSGAFSIDSDGGATKQFVLKTVRNKKFTRMSAVREE